mgnify:FL=1
MSNLTGTYKSVILLMTIGEDRAAEVFKHLSQREVQTLSAAMANVTQISNKQLTDVLAEFEQEAEQFAAEDKKRREAVDAKNEAENIVYQAEKLVSESGDKIPEDDKNAINTKVAALKEAISKDDAALIGTAKEDLQKTLNDAAAKLYQQAAPQGGAPDMNGAQPNGGNPTGNNGGDPNVYDADFTDVDDNK